MYADDDRLLLSGIQHYSFCPRQWALIHLERLWADNVHTVKGELMHARAHDETLRERRGDSIVVRGLSVASSHLGVYGVCDVVEFRKSKEGHPLHGEDGLWSPTPVEYKKGSAKAIDADRLQLCAQAMCLEEMLGCDVPVGFLYYGATRARELVQLDDGLRRRVEDLLSEMHDLFGRKHVPKARRKRHCAACSLVDMCMPVGAAQGSVKEYIASAMTE